MPPHALGLTTRYARPVIRPYVIPRPRLLDRLHSAIGNGTTIIQAPGGFGKSTLAAQFSADLEFATSWLALDSSCGAPEAFAEQVAGAVLGPAARPPVSTEGDGALHAYLGAALRDFEATSPLPLLLVIDNAQELIGSDESLALLGWLLQSLPLGSEALVITREPISLPDLDRQVAGGDVLVLLAHDLAFTAEEVTQVIERAAKVDEVDATEIYDATGGWPVAVRGVLSGTLSLEGASRAAAGGVWDRYLVAEVWDAVPERLREPFMIASVPAAAESGLLQSLVPKDEWAVLADWLDRHDFFVESTGNGDRRINPVVQRFLRERLQTADAATFARALGTTVGELSAHGRIIDAFELVIGHRSHAELQALLLENAPSLLQRGSFVTLRRAFAALDIDRASETTDLKALHARVLAHTGDPKEALALADDVLDASGPSLEALHHARLARARALRLLGRMDEVADSLDVPMDDLPSDKGLQAEFAWHRAHAFLALDSDLDRALDLLRECLDKARETNAALLELLCRSTIGHVLGLKGDGPASVRELTAAAMGWREQQGAAHLAWVLNNLGMAHLTVGDTESAIASLSEAREESVMARDRRGEAFAVASLGDAYLALGNAKQARTCYEETIEICSEHPLDESLVALATAGLAGALLDLGEVARADFVVRRAVEMAEQLGSPFELGTCLLQQAAVASASELHQEAATSARRAVEMLGTIGAEAAHRTALYRLALIYFRDGDRDAAESVLTELSEILTAPWMVGGLQPLLREHPLFAQWVEKRPASAGMFGKAIRALDFAPAPELPESKPTYPRIIAQSLGTLRVFKDGQEVADEAWESIRAKEMFYLLLARPDGVRKEEAVEHLYPDLPASRCNSQFHSNLYRIRRALYKEGVIKRGGAYMLNPDGEFEWDVREYASLLDRASVLPAGSTERAAAHEKALQTYRGPFAEAFYSEWAASLRDDLARRNVETLAHLGGYYAGREDFESAAACMEEVLKVSHFNDEAAAQLATYRSRAGQPAAALSFLDSYRDELWREMEEEFPPRLTRLRRDIASGIAV